MPECRNKTGHIVDMEFECPICGSSKYEGGYIRTGFEYIGGRIYPSYYICKGCSVVFENPELFNKKVKK